MALSETALERSETAKPLTPLSEECREIASLSARPGEPLPLVTGSAQDGAFRATTAYWVTDAGHDLMMSCDEVKAKVMAWDGKYPDASRWMAAEWDAKRSSQARVAKMQAVAQQREADGLARQVEAARLRLLREVGKYLVSLGHGTGDLNAVLYQQLQCEDIASRRDLNAPFIRLVSSTRHGRRFSSKNWKCSIEPALRTSAVVTSPARR